MLSRNTSGSAIYLLRKSVDHEQRALTPTCQGKSYGKRQERRQASEEEGIGCQESRFPEENASVEEGSVSQEDRTCEEGWDGTKSSTSEEES